MNTYKWVTNKFFRTWGFPFLRRYWRSCIMETVAESLDQRSQDACLKVLQKSRTLHELVQNLITLGQEFEMSASMASVTGNYEMYKAFMQAAANCYNFAFTYSSDPQQKEKMHRARQEIEHRLELKH